MKKKFQKKLVLGKTTISNLDPLSENAARNVKAGINTVDPPCEPTIYTNNCTCTCTCVNTCAQSCTTGCVNHCWN